MTNYDLEDVESIVGTFTVRLSSEFVGLTKPTYNTILEIGNLEEANNITVSESEIGNLTLTITDDYSTYTEGFWYKVLQGETQIRLYLSEGGTDKFFFYGTPQLDSVEWSEQAIDGSTVRVCTLTLVSVVGTIWDIPIASWVSEVYANKVLTGYAASTPAYSVLNLRGLFSALLSAPTSPLTGTISSVGTAVTGVGTSFAVELSNGDFIQTYGGRREVTNIADATHLTVASAFTTIITDLPAGTPYFKSFTGLNPTYSIDDSTMYFYSPTQDFDFRKGGVAFTLNDIWIATTYNTGGGEFQTDYFDANSANYLGTRYSQMKNMLQDILRNFGLVMRMSYDTATDRHLIQLIQKGRAYSYVLTFGGREKSSSISRSTNLTGVASRATFLLNSATFVWFEKPSYTYRVDTVPNYVEFDVDYTVPFLIDPGMSAPSAYPIWLGATVGTVGLADNINYWRYVAGAYESPSWATIGTKIMLQAVAGYAFNRFTMEMTACTRVYGSLKANDGSTESFVHPQIIKRTNIDLDGAGDVVFFANKVIKRPMQNETEIEWLKETN